MGERQSLSLVAVYLEINLHPFPLQIPAPENIYSWVFLIRWAIYSENHRAPRVLAVGSKHIPRLYHGHPMNDALKGRTWPVPTPGNPRKHLQALS